MSVEVRDRRKPGWFWIENEIVDQIGPKHGAYADAVYSVLARCANTEGRCWPSHRFICEHLHLSAPTVISALKALATAGAIHMESGKAAGKVTVYTLTDSGYKPHLEGSKQD
jgi:hypothetical protein